MMLSTIFYGILRKGDTYYQSKKSNFLQQRTEVNMNKKARSRFYKVVQLHKAC